MLIDTELVDTELVDTEELELLIELVDIELVDTELDELEILDELEDELIELELEDIELELLEIELELLEELEDVDIELLEDEELEVDVEVVVVASPLSHPQTTNVPAPPLTVICNLLSAALDVLGTGYGIMQYLSPVDSSKVCSNRTCSSPSTSSKIVTVPSLVALICKTLTIKRFPDWGCQTVCSVTAPDQV